MSTCQQQREREIKAFFMETVTGVVTDAMLLLGIEGWMDEVLPFRAEEKLFGHAFTIQLAPLRGAGEPDYTFYDLSELWNPGDVLVVGGMETNCSLMGENVARICLHSGAAGAVLNGRVRDYLEIKNMEFPVFGRGACVRTRQKYQCFAAYNVPVTCAGAQVHPGDYVFGDGDGVVVFPAARVGEVMAQARRVIEVERQMEKAIAERRPIAEVNRIASQKKRLLSKEESPERAKKEGVKKA